MIQNSFIILPKVAKTKERSIWNQNIKTWNDFLNARSIKGIADTKKPYFDRVLERAKMALRNDDISFFKKHLQQSEMWRLYKQFREDACFLDIETSGHNGYITVIGIYDGHDVKTLVKNKNLYPQLLKKALEEYKMIITYNGSSYDLPILEKYYPGIIPDVLHLDLKHCCTRLGLKGGLKQIEEQLNIKRPIHLKAYGSDNPIDLWRAYMASGREEYLQTLVDYNSEDVINLLPLADYCYNKLKEQCLESRSRV